MKKFFTLIAMALMAVSANAQEWRPTTEAPAAGVSIIKGDLLKVNTVFETTCGAIQDEGGNADPQTFAGKTFETYIQIRVDAAPTAATPTGTDKGGSTPLVITAKKNVDLTIYYRRQNVDGAAVENDGKDIKLIDQAAPSTLISAASFEAFDINGDYSNAKKVFKLEEGKTYTLWARGTTARLYGIDYVEGTGGGSGEGGGDVTATEFTVTFNGKDDQTIANYFSFGTDENKHNFNSKFTDASWNDIDFTSGLKMEGSTLIAWNSTAPATVTVVQSTWSEKGFYLDDVFQDPANTTAGTGCRIYTIENVPAGEHKITRSSGEENAGESGLFAVVVKYNGSTNIQNIQVANTENAPVYNLSGQMVDKSYKGVVIQNGRKMIQK